MWVGRGPAGGGDRLHAGDLLGRPDLLAFAWGGASPDAVDVVGEGVGQATGDDRATAAALSCGFEKLGVVPADEEQFGVRPVRSPAFPGQGISDFLTPRGGFRTIRAQPRWVSYTPRPSEAESDSTVAQCTE